MVRGRCKGQKKNKEKFTKSKMENKKFAYFLNKRKPDRLFAVIKRRGVKSALLKITDNHK